METNVTPPQSPEEFNAAKKAARLARKEAHGKAKVTKGFAKRMIDHYNSRIIDGDQPAEIAHDLTTPDGGFRQDVIDNSTGLIDGIGQRRDKTDAETHEAVKRVGAAFKLKVQDPRKPKAQKPKPQPQPKPQPKPQQQPQPPQGGQGKPQPKDDKGDGEKQKSPGAGKGDKDQQEQQPQPGQGQGQGKQEQEEQPPQQGQGGGGDGKDADEEGDGQGDKGEGKGGGDSGKGKGSSRAAHDKQADDAERGEADEPVDIDMDAERAAFKDIQSLDVPDAVESTMSRDTDRAGATAFEFAKTNGLMAKLREELASIARVRKFSGRTYGEVDFDKCADIATGQNLDRVYYTQRNARRINTAVQILVDTSGSTSGSVIQTTSGLAHVISNVLEKMRVPVQVISFQGSAYLVKDWHERTAAANIPLLCSGGGTHLPHAQLRAAKDLAKRKEKRKIQFVITDGDTGWQTVPEIEATIKQINEHCERNMRDGSWTAEYAKQYRDNVQTPNIRQLQPVCPGVESYAFGIGVKLKSGVFDVAISDLNMASMCDVVAKCMGKALMKEPKG